MSLHLRTDQQPCWRVRDARSKAPVWSAMIVQPKDQTPIKLRYGKSTIAGIHGMGVRSWCGASVIEGV